MSSCTYCQGKLLPFAQFRSERVVDVMLTPALQQQLPELSYGRCGDCGSLMAIDRRSDGAFNLVQLYQQLPPSYWTALETDHGDRFFATLEQQLNPQGLPLSIGDVGCGDGGILRRLGNHWQKTGIEPGGVAQCPGDDGIHGGIHWVSGTLADSGLPKESFDVLLYVDVFEHLRDPRQEMAVARQFLKPGGRLVIYTGNAAAPTARLAGENWAYLRCVGHVAVASRQGLVTALTAAGFEVTAVLAQNHPSSPGMSKWLFEWLGSRLRRHWAVPLLHDHLLAIAQRPMNP